MHLASFCRWAFGAAVITVAVLLWRGPASDADALLFPPGYRSSKASSIRLSSARPVPRSAARPSVRSSIRSSARSSLAPVARTWGAYVGWQASEGPAFEKLVGKPMTARAVFVHWGNERAFPAYLAPVMNGKTLVVFWEATDYEDGSVDQEAFSYRAILRGDWDAYFVSFAKEAKAYGKPVILIPFDEMNGDWYPWSGTQNGNTPADHIAAYRHVHSFFGGAPNVKFGWAVNSDSVPDTAANGIDAYYPGAAYVDVVGVDGFNFGKPWMTFDQVFGSALSKLKRYGKPIYIFSMASAEGTKKATWITDALVTRMKKHPQIAGWIWFHEKKENDWRVNSDAASLKAFKKALP